jgi:anti-sigma regulatory factor (Ser/Thr protein kinase)
VRAACANQTGADARDTAELVVSELAGNAVRHARSTFRAEVSFRNGSLRVAVTDAQPLPEGWDGFPIARDHGLGLVSALADDWAIEPLAGGKVVWAELARNGQVH